MTKYQILAGANMDTVKSAYSEIGLIESLIEGPEELVASAGLSASQVYAYVLGDPAQALRIKEAMLGNLELRKLYRRMVEAAAVYRMPEAIAASTDEFPERQTGGCRIRVVRSEAEADQYYVIIELDEGAKSVPETLVVCDNDNHSAQLPLSAPQRGIIQVTVDEDSGVPRMLRNPKSGIYLR